MNESNLKVYRSDEWITSDCNFHIFFSNKSGSIEPHTHDFIEIVYVMSGNAVEKVNDGEYEVKRGDLIFINYQSTHTFIPNTDFSYVNICFKPETVDSLITPENVFALLQLTAFDELRRENDDGMVSFFGSERDEIESLLQSMLSEYRSKHSFRRAVLDSYMNILLVKILRKTAAEPHSAERSGTWQEIADYIDLNLGEELTLSALAQKCFYNPSYFSRIFKEHFDMSLTEYINRRRVELAKKLLSKGTVSVEEIAYRVGYPSKSSFYRAFTRITGTTPAEYKKQK